MSDLYLRKVGLAVVMGQKALDLSQMRIVFRTQAADEGAPATAHIKVYNLSDHTAQSVQKEYQSVTLQAGYENGPYGQIFNGTIVQVKRGREIGAGGVVDTYVQIDAADSDIFHNFQLINGVLAAGATKAQQAQTLATQAQQNKTLTDAKLEALKNQTSPTGGVLPRGKVLFGMARDILDDLAASTGTAWSIQNGVLTFRGLTTYDPGDIVVLTAKTGLIVVPEATDNGIRVQTLLNPFLQIARRVQIDNKSINTTAQHANFGLQYQGLNYIATTNDDGIYRILVVEHAGDSRGQQWQTDLVCLNVDPSSAPAKAVKAYG
jgi:hypothetical protein